MNKPAIAILAGALAGCTAADKTATVDTEHFGTTKYGEKATLYTLYGKGGLVLQVRCTRCTEKAGSFCR